MPSLLRRRLRSVYLEDYYWLKMAESAFEFWNNEEDAIYDRL